MPNEYIDTYSVPIVVVAIEGPSDGTYLIDPLEAYFRDKYGSVCRLVKIKDVTGDPNVDTKTFIKDLSLRIESELSNSENKIDANVAVMIREIVHVFDIDEAFIDDSLIIEDLSHDEFFYTREGIRFNSVNSVKQRNARKAERIRELIGINSITVFDISFPYRAYYFSINIDDFHNENALNISDDEKARLAAVYRRKYIVKKSEKGKVKMFLKLFKDTNPEDYPNDYYTTWNYIQINNNSLKKCSNAFLIIDPNYIKQ